MSSSPQKQQIVQQLKCSQKILQDQSEKELKQQYLREQILQKNFNTEDFVEYLNQKLNIDSDISKCSFDDLKKVVKSYIEKVKKFQIHMSEFDQNNESIMSSRFSSLSFTKPPAMIKINSQPLIFQEQFNQTVKCYKIEQRQRISEIKSKKIECRVYSPQRKFVTSILGINTSSYLEFKITTYGLGWEVGRRYSDFIWLRSSLKRFFPSQIIPPIPNKKAHKRSPRQLQKRMKILALFLNDILSYPEFLNSRYVEGFLSYPQQKFNSFKKQIDSKKSFESITTTETQTGDVQIHLSQQIVSYNKKLDTWIGQSEVMLKQLTRSSKNLQRGIIDQVNTLYGMGDQLAGLYSGAQKISKLDQRPNNGFFRLKQIFVALNNMVIEWGSVLKNQIQLIQNNCNTVFKYVRQSMSGFRQIIDQMKVHQASYFQTKLQLDSQKQKLFTLNDIQKWEIPKKELAFIPKSALYEKKQAFKLMLPKQSSVLQKLKITYCYYLSRIYENSNFGLGLKASLICGSMQEFTIKQKVLNQQIGELWNQMCYNFSHAFEQKGSKIKKLQVRTQQKIRKQQSEIDNEQAVSQSSISVKGGKKW